jgi:hypothetical protein
MKNAHSLYRISRRNVVGMSTVVFQNTCVGTGADPGFNAQENTNKTLTTGPFGNTCEADEVSPEVEAGVVA